MAVRKHQRDLSPDNRPGHARAPSSKSGDRTGSRNSRHYRRAQRDRGAETRAQLIEAALDVFGRLGFEGASTREIARAAGANLASIVYHFGGKEALHIAVAEYIVQQLSARLGPALAILATADVIASPEKAREALIKVISIQADVLLGSAEAERWARFIVREQMQPTAAFDLIYKMMGGAHMLATKLVAVALGREEDEDIKVLVFTLIGQILVFRVAQALVRKRLGWPSIGDAERARIKKIIAANINAILDREGAS